MRHHLLFNHYPNTSWGNNITMSDEWQQTAIISPGGTVFHIAVDDTGRIWLATAAGIFFQNDGGWSAPAQGQPLTQLNALACADGRLLAGGGQGEIAYSSDGGQTWYQGRVSPANAPITCLAIAPNFRQNGVALAGTDGAGLLRSTDKGRSWQSANFGLLDFTVIALATAPNWERRELAFAATAHGLYRSPNGGRAWKKADTGLEGAVVQVITVSPNFAVDRTVLVGTESRGIFRSTDGGKSWRPCSQGITPVVEADEAPPINGLWLHPEFATSPVGVAASGDGQIFYTADGGANWRPAARGDHAVLALGGTDRQLLAGLLNQGLLSSSDGGQSWNAELQLAARAFTRLVGRGPALLAYGPLEQVWRSTDGGRSWSPLPELAGTAGPLLAVAASPEPEPDQADSPACLLAATADGLLRSLDEGQSWQIVIPEEEVISICFSAGFARDGRVWVGTGRGQVLASADGGQTWVPGAPPKPGMPVVALASLSLSARAGSETLAAVTFAPDQQQMTLWRSGDGGSSWQQWQQAGASWPSAHITLVGPAESERVIVCLERRGWVLSASGWQRVLETARPITRLSRLAGNSGLLALTSQQVLYSPDGLNWSDWTAGLAGQTLLDLAPGPVSDEGQTIFVLTSGGVLWQRLRAG